MSFNSEERIGVYSVAKIFVEEFNWIFREQSVNDFGLDGYVELTKLHDYKTQKYYPTGKIIGVQIKSGVSFFNEIDKFGNIIFRGVQKHLSYWLNHNISVIIILYDKSKNLAYWQVINTENVETTGENFKLKIPQSRILNKENISTLTEIANFKNSYEYKLWNLKNSLDEIEYLKSIQKLYLYVELEEYKQKYNVGLTITDEFDDYCEKLIYNHDSTNLNRWQYFYSLSCNDDLIDSIKEKVSWANIYLDNNIFDNNSLRNLVYEFVGSVDDKEIVDEVNYLKKHNKFLKIACLLTGNFFFMLEIEINELSNSFLFLNSYLSKNQKI